MYSRWVGRAVLLIACANLNNCFLARSAARQKRGRAFGVGATRGRIAAPCWSKPRARLPCGLAGIGLAALLIEAAVPSYRDAVTAE